MTTEAIDLAVAAATAVAAGLVGCFAVMRRMALAADALSHIALPGIAVALAFHVNPLFGAVVMLAFGAVLVWGLERQTRISTDTIIGVVFSAALAAGSLMTSGEDLIDALFGRTAPLSWSEAAFGFVAAVAVAAFVIRMRHRLVVALVSPDLLRTSGVDIRRLNLVYLLMFALTVALGLRHLGVLLMGSLVIIPAATARRFATHLTAMLALSATIAAAVTVTGSMLAAWRHWQAGPVVVILAAAGFALALVRPAR